MYAFFIVRSACALQFTRGGTRGGNFSTRLGHSSRAWEAYLLYACVAGVEWRVEAEKAHAGERKAAHRWKDVKGRSERWYARSFVIRKK